MKFTIYLRREVTEWASITVDAPSKRALQEAVDADPSQVFNAASKSWEADDVSHDERIDSIDRVGAKEESTYALVDGKLVWRRHKPGVDL